MGTVMMLRRRKRRIQLAELRSCMLYNLPLYSSFISTFITIMCYMLRPRMCIHTN